MAYREDFMRRAIELSEQALQVEGAGPYAAVVVQDGRIVGEGFNRAICNHDPTSHGEVEAMRAACINLKTVDLSGCELYASCEPCALCVATMAITGVAQLYYAASSRDAIAAMPFSPDGRPWRDSQALRIEAGTEVGKGKLPAQQHLQDAALAVLERAARTYGQSPS